MGASQSQILTQIVRQSTAEIAAGHRQFVVRLAPRSLGSIDISISYETNAVVLRIAAGVQRTEKLIESDVERLRAAFQALLTQLALSSGDQADSSPPVC